MKFTATLANGKEHVATFYSIGGGFVVKEERVNAKKKIEIKHAFPFPTDKSRRFSHCTAQNKKISEIVYENEKSMRTPVIDHELMRIWNTMLECMYIVPYRRNSAGRLERAS
jgi:L-serine dehydratase